MTELDNYRNGIYFRHFYYIYNSAQANEEQKFWIFSFVVVIVVFQYTNHQNKTVTQKSRFELNCGKSDLLPPFQMVDKSLMFCSTFTYLILIESTSIFYLYNQ